jgi:hypothetical protein
MDGRWLSTWPEHLELALPFCGIGMPPTNLANTPTSMKLKHGLLKVRLWETMPRVLRKSPLLFKGDKGFLGKPSSGPLPSGGWS